MYTFNNDRIIYVCKIVCWTFVTRKYIECISADAYFMKILTFDSSKGSLPVTSIFPPLFLEFCNISLSSECKIIISCYFLQTLIECTYLQSFVGTWHFGRLCGTKRIKLICFMSFAIETISCLTFTPLSHFLLANFNAFSKEYCQSISCARTHGWILYLQETLK